MPAGPATPPAAAAAAAAHPEDRYQLPCATLRAPWPHPALLQLLSQQADCCFDQHLPALLPPAAAAAAACSTGSSSSSSNRLAIGEACVVECAGVMCVINCNSSWV
jgi:hypothetical protein